MSFSFKVMLFGEAIGLLEVLCALLVKNFSWGKKVVFCNCNCNFSYPQSSLKRVRAFQIELEFEIVGF